MELRPLAEVGWRALRDKKDTGLARLALSYGVPMSALQVGEDGQLFIAFRYMPKVMAASEEPTVRRAGVWFLNAPLTAALPEWVKVAVTAELAQFIWDDMRKFSGTQS